MDVIRLLPCPDTNPMNRNLPSWGCDPWSKFGVRVLPPAHQHAQTISRSNILWITHTIVIRVLDWRSATRPAAPFGILPGGGSWEVKFGHFLLGYVRWGIALYKCMEK